MPIFIHVNKYVVGISYIPGTYSNMEDNMFDTVPAIKGITVFNTLYLLS